MKRKTVLVVDDERDIQKTVKTVLEKNGIQVMTADNGDDCLKILEKVTVDLVLLDIMMPGTPVREVIPKIQTKIAFMTVVRTSEAEKEELTKPKNVVAFIQKPFDIFELLHTVKQIVGA